MRLEVEVQHSFGAFDLQVQLEAAGGVTAIFGRSGAGKTSVINAVAGLFRPDAGRITLDGEVLFDSKGGLFLPPARRRLGYVFQDARLFPHLTVRENLLFGARFAPQGARGPELAEVLALLGLEALTERRPAGLSGGEKQRVALGRALLSRPRMLLMDEPLASLDSPRKQEILPYLERLRDGPLGLPILYVSHALDEVARLANQLVLMGSGRVLRQGPLQEVMADPAAVSLLGVREAGAVLIARVLEQGADGLARLGLSAGELLLPGVEAPVGTSLRLRVLAQDVMISLTRPEGLSAMNILPVTVEQVHQGEGPGAAIALRSGEDRLLARVTRRAVTDLSLAPGLNCFAILKATSVAPVNIGR